MGHSERVLEFLFAFHHEQEDISGRSVIAKTMTRFQEEWRRIANAASRCPSAATGAAAQSSAASSAACLASPRSTAGSAHAQQQRCTHRRTRRPPRHTASSRRWRSTRPLHCSPRLLQSQLETSSLRETWTLRHSGAPQTSRRFSTCTLRNGTLPRGNYARWISAAPIAPTSSSLGVPGSGALLWLSDSPGRGRKSPSPWTIPPSLSPSRPARFPIKQGAIRSTADNLMITGSGTSRWMR